MFSSFEILPGSAHNDSLTGTFSDEAIYGGAGNDTLNANHALNSAPTQVHGDAGDDLFLILGSDFFGGADVDILDLSGATRVGYEIDLFAETFSEVGGTNWDLQGFESVIASPEDDVILGTPGNDTLEGGAGGDSIDGNGGIDTVLGGQGCSDAL